MKVIKTYFSVKSGELVGGMDVKAFLKIVFHQ
jgi:hypothetical protein